MTHPRRTSDRVVKIPRPHEPHCPSCTRVFQQHSLQYVLVFSIYFHPTVVPLGSSWDLNYFCSAGLITGGRNAKTGRQKYFLTAVDPLDTRMTTPRVEEGHPRMLQYKLKLRAAYDTVCWFDLRSAQNKGLEFWQTKSNAIV